MKNNVLVTGFMVLLLIIPTSCSENDDDPEVIHDNDTSIIIFKLDVYLLSETLPVTGVTVIYEDTSFLTGESGHFSVEKDSGTMLDIFFGHPDFKNDTLSLLLVKDTIVFFELTPVDTPATSGDFYPVILNHTWKYHYTHSFYLEPGYPADAFRDYIIERKIIDFDDTQIVSEIHMYGEILNPLETDTAFVDSVFQVVETYGENGRVNSFIEIFRAADGFQRLVLNRYMEEGLNEGKMDIEFTKPLTYVEYQSDNPISETWCLYANSIEIWPYSPYFFNEIYLADSLGLVELNLQYGGNTATYYNNISLINFYENK